VRHSWLQSIFKFLQNPRKPVILAMSRPDAKKNLTTLVKAFGENETLKKLANLVLIMVPPPLKRTHLTFSLAQELLYPTFPETLHIQ